MVIIALSQRPGFCFRLETGG